MRGSSIPALNQYEFRHDQDILHSVSQSSRAFDNVTHAPRSTEIGHTMIEGTIYMNLTCAVGAKPRRRLIQNPIRRQRGGGAGGGGFGGGAGAGGGGGGGGGDGAHLSGSSTGKDAQQ